VHRLNVPAFTVSGSVPKSQKKPNMWLEGVHACEHYADYYEAVFLLVNGVMTDCWKS